MKGAQGPLSSIFRPPTSDRRLPTSDLRPPTSGHRSAFTLIELLTAMTILVIIVMIALRIFLQSSTVWNISSTRARNNMLGRAATDYVAQKYAVTTNKFGDVTVGDLGVTPPAPTQEKDPVSDLLLSVAVQTTVTVTDKLRASAAVQVSSNGPDGIPNTPDDINSWQ